MSSVENVQNWFDAVEMYDQGIVEEAIDKFGEVTKSAKILFNIGCCYLKLEEIENAVSKYNEAIQLDPHMAIAYFMLGLTNFVDEEYNEAMKYFQISFEKLRGNRFVDYRQLGFKYQLYSCEILTNQAVCAYRLSKLGKAKGLLLQAVGCKAEKKHESIVESLSLLQSGYPISPFIPPQSEIFRPSKAAVSNLKKKNYLGKSKVISTENTEEIYACFSGIRSQANEPSVPVTREKLLSEIKTPERKLTLRHNPRPPKQRPQEVGRVVESPPISKSSGKRRPPPGRDLPPAPRGSSSPTPPRKGLPRAPSLQPRGLPPSRSRSPSPPSARTLPKNKPPSRPAESATLPPRSKLPPSPVIKKKLPSLPPLMPDDNNNFEENSLSDEETYEQIDDSNFKFKPNRPPPILPKRNESTNAEEPVTRARLPSNPVPNRRPQKIASNESIDQPPVELSNRTKKESTVSKPGRLPPPPPPATSESPKEDIITPPPRKFFTSPSLSLNDSKNETELKNEINNILKKNTKPNEIVSARKKSSVSTPQSVTAPPRKDSSIRGDEVDPTSRLPTPMKNKDKLNYEIEVQYTFVHKLSVPDGISLEELEEMVKEKGVPDDIELCFNDDLGRQQTLTEKKMKRVFNQENGSVKKLFCFPDS